MTRSMAPPPPRPWLPKPQRSTVTRGIGFREHFRAATPSPDSLLNHQPSRITIKPCQYVDNQLLWEGCVDSGSFFRWFWLPSGCQRLRMHYFRAWALFMGDTLLTPRHIITTLSPHTSTTATTTILQMAFVGRKPAGSTCQSLHFSSSMLRCVRLRFGVSPTR